LGFEKVKGRRRDPTPAMGKINIIIRITKEEKIKKIYGQEEDRKNMVDWLIGSKFHFRNLELFTIIALTIIYTLAIMIEPGTVIYEWIAGLSQAWANFATNSESALPMAFIFSTFGNTTVLITVPYTLIVFNIGQIYPNYWILGLVSGIGAGLGEITSYIAGRVIASSKKISESEFGEKFHRIRMKFERKPGLIPLTIFICAATPIPDDIILVPFGMMKYPYWKSIPPCMAGKTVLCTFMAYLGYLVGQNANVINDAIEQYPFLFFLRLVVPSDKINPAADLVQFSFIFIVIYIIARIDFDKMIKNRSGDRKDFELLLLKGINIRFDELVQRFHIQNTTNFEKFLIELAGKHENLKFNGQILHIDAISDTKLAYSQSMEFADFLFH
jgi:membrane protein DedA with SNARE-associated domain